MTALTHGTEQTCCSVTLVAIPQWDLCWLSTDPSEGKSSIDLPVSI